MRRAVALLAASAVVAGTLGLAQPGSAASAPTANRLTPAQRAHVGARPELVEKLRKLASRHRAARGTIATAAPASTPVTVTVTGDRVAVVRQVHRLGGTLLANVGDQASVTIPRGRLDDLRAAPGISGVRTPTKARQLAVTSEGVAASGADVWQNAAQNGAGVTVAVVDSGFAGATAEKNAGRLGANTLLFNAKGSNGQGECTTHGSDYGDDQHGTAVAEIVQQMAPSARLMLFCISTNIGFAAAKNAIIGNPNIKIVTSSLGFPGDSRGDGTGDATSAAATVRDARKHGVLWIQSAGNNAVDHWTGNLVDADRDGLIDLKDTTTDGESDFVTVGPDAAIEVQWDQWPTSSASVELIAYGFQCTNPNAADHCGLQVLNGGNPYTALHESGDIPFLELCNFAGDSSCTLDKNFNDTGEQFYLVSIASNPNPSMRYDLTYEGNVGPSDYACNADPADSNGTCRGAVRGYSGSVTAPANSPYALAVGAADVGDNSGDPRGTLELFSSRGPTIDGRNKPDLLGWDGVSSNLSEFVDGFYGTSAAAPHVAGAAALVKAANSNLDAAQIQNLLEQRANSAAPYNPPSPAFGHGKLTLGPPTAVTAPAAANFQTIVPVRVLDTRTTLGGHRGRLGAGQTLTLSIPTLPADATAVAINLTGVNASGPTFLSAYPGGTAYPGTSNLNLKPPSDATAAVFAVVTVKNKSITIRNGGGTIDVVVDELGYFGTGSETGRYTALSSPNRVTAGVNLPAHGTTSVKPQLPAGATAAVINLTTSSAKSGGYVGAAPTCAAAQSTLNFSTYSRANLAVVQLDGTGGFCVRNGPTAVKVFVDVLGYMGPTGAQYVALPSAQRVVDTRTGNGGNAGGASSRALAGGRTTQFYVTGIGDVPATATAVLANVVEASNDRGGFLTLFAGNTVPPTSSLNYSPGRVVANAAVAGVRTGNLAVYARVGATQAAIDVSGYFIAP